MKLRSLALFFVFGLTSCAYDPRTGTYVADPVAIGMISGVAAGVALNGPYYGYGYGSPYWGSSYNGYAGYWGGGRWYGPGYWSGGYYSGGRYYGGRYWTGNNWVANGNGRWHQACPKHLA